MTYIWQRLQKILKLERPNACPSLRIFELNSLDCSNKKSCCSAKRTVLVSFVFRYESENLFCLSFKPRNDSHTWSVIESVNQLHHSHWSDLGNTCFLVILRDGDTFYALPSHCHKGFTLVFSLRELCFLFGPPIQVINQRDVISAFCRIDQRTHNMTEMIQCRFLFEFVSHFLTHSFLHSLSSLLFNSMFFSDVMCQIRDSQDSQNTWVKNGIVDKTMCESRRELN